MDSKIKNLISYVPTIYENVDEMEKLISSEQPIIDEFDELIHKTFNNTFILTSDESGIAVFEKLFDIVPDKLDTLQTRRLRVLTVWGRLVPYTYRTLVQKLSQICGEREFDVVKDFDDYKLKITVHDVETAIVDAIRKMCIFTIPVNMIWWIEQLIRITFYYYEHILMKLKLRFPIYDSIPTLHLKMKFRARFIEKEGLVGYTRRLDGTWNLDGSVLLNAVPYTLKIYSKIRIQNKEKIYVTINGEPV